MSDPKPGTDRTNPKDLVGQAKVDLSLFPPAAHIHGAHAFMDGAVKYGPYNWRERQVRARVYISAAQRHLADFLDGENLAQDSGVHHLGHVIACCGIILDALETGNLIDDRPVTGAASAILDRVNAGILARREAGKSAPRPGVTDFREALADVKARLAVLPPPPEPVFGPCLCQPGMRCVFFDDCANHPETEQAPHPSPTHNVVVTAGADVQVDKIAAIVEAHFRRIVSDEVDTFPALVDGDPLDIGCDRMSGRVVLNASAPRWPLYDCRCHPGAACNLGPHCEASKAPPEPWGSPDVADCGCAKGVRCHSTFKPRCPRLVEGRDTGKPGSQDTGTKAPAAVDASHPGRIGYGE